MLGIGRTCKSRKAPIIHNACASSTHQSPAIRYGTVQQINSAKHNRLHLRRIEFKRNSHNVFGNKNVFALQHHNIARSAYTTTHPIPSGSFGGTEKLPFDVCLSVARRTLDTGRVVIGIRLVSWLLCLLERCSSDSMDTTTTVVTPRIERPTNRTHIRWYYVHGLALLLEIMCIPYWFVSNWSFHGCLIWTTTTKTDKQNRNVPQHGLRNYFNFSALTQCLHLHSIGIIWPWAKPSTFRKKRKVEVLSWQIGN